MKKVVKRLENEGVLEGDRPRKPGPNVRVLTIADDVVAKDELEALVRAYDREFGTTASVRAVMERLTPKSKEHLRRRGLWPDWTRRVPLKVALSVKNQ